MSERHTAYRDVHSMMLLFLNLRCAYAETVTALTGQVESLEAAFNRLGAEHAAAQQAAAAGQAAVSQLTTEKEELAAQLSAVTAQKVCSQFITF